MIFLLRADNLDLITKTSSKPKLRNTLQNSWQILQNVRVMKGMERLRNWQIEENGEDTTIKCNIGSALHRGPEKGKHMKIK